MERRMVKRSEIAACLGSNSQKRNPEVFVAMVWKGPRYSDGAPGLGSQVSRWLAPPCRKTTIIAFRLVPAEFAAAAVRKRYNDGRFKAPSPKRPSRRNSRRP